MKLPEIVYFQTIDGHKKMAFEMYKTVIEWLADQGYIGKLSFSLHYEPSLDPRLPGWIEWTRDLLPLSIVEIVTNGIKRPPELWNAVDVIEWVESDNQGVKDQKCLSKNAMCLAATGEFILCREDYKHQAVVGTWKNISAARACQLKQVRKERYSP